MTIARSSRLAALLFAAVLATQPVRAGDLEDRFFHDIEVDYGDDITAMIAQGFDPNTRNARGQAALFVALQGQSLKAAKALWEAPGIRIDETNKAGETPLMMAAMKGEADAAAALVARGAATQRPGWSPLHYAATGGNAAIVTLLLSHGAVLEARSPNGTTPLMMAARYGSEAAVDALLAAGASRTLVNDEGMDAAAFAASAGREKLADRLKAPAR